MTDKAVISGTFADLKTVKTRSVVQMIIEVPIEQGKQVVEAFGFPQPGAEIPVAVARIKDEEPQAPEKPSRPGRKFDDMPPSQQAGMLCNDGAFQLWTTTQTAKSNPRSATHETARWLILTECGINSRSNLDSNAAAEQRWNAMLMQFRADTGRTTEQRG